MCQATTGEESAASAHLRFLFLRVSPFLVGVGAGRCTLTDCYSGINCSNKEGGRHFRCRRHVIVPLGCYKRVSGIESRKDVAFILSSNNGCSCCGRLEWKSRLVQQVFLAFRFRTDAITVTSAMAVVAETMKMWASM